MSRSYLREESLVFPPVVLWDGYERAIDSADAVLAPAWRLILQYKPPWPLPVYACGTLEFMDDAFALGCTDYLVEPWLCAEMTARVRARACTLHLSCGLHFTPASAMLCGPCGSLRLSHTLLRLFRVLAANRGRTIRSNELATLAGIPSGSSRALAMAVCRLRVILARLCGPQGSDLILADGGGYMLAGE